MTFNNQEHASEHFLIKDENGRLVMGVSRKFLSSQLIFCSTYFLFSLLLFCFSSYAFEHSLHGHIVKQVPLLCYDAMFPLFGIFGLVRSLKELRDGNYYLFDRDSGVITYLAQKTAFFHDVKHVKIVSGLGWHGRMIIQVCLQNGKSVRVLDARPLFVLQHLNPQRILRFQIDYKLMSIVNNEIMSIALKIGQYIGADVRDESVLL